MNNVFEDLRIKVSDFKFQVPEFGYVLLSGIFIILLSSDFAHAKDTPMLERLVTISLTRERMDVALKKISQQADFTFSYNPAIIDAGKIVSLNFSNRTIREVLDELFDGNIDYKERRRYVILTKVSKRISIKDSRTVSGYVTDDSTGQRLKDVTVYDPASLSSTITDSYGFFEIKINKPSPDLILAVNKLSYTDTLVVVPSKRGLLKIKMKNSRERFLTAKDSLKIKWSRFWTKNLLSTEGINVTDTIYRPVQVSIFPFLGTNHKLSGNVINDYSFNIYGGYSLGVRKLELGGTFNIVRGNVEGAQLAGTFNAVNGKTKGLQMAGVINANRDSIRGAQFAGLINLNWNTVQKFSAAGLLNLTRHQSNAVVLAGLGNITLGSQNGSHIAGLLNFASKDSGPIQLAGLLNFTVRKVKGVQIAGLVNYATHVKGAQIGFINVADSIEGVPIGFISFVLKGYHKIEISADEIFYTNLAFRTGVHKFYNIFTAGIKPQTSAKNYWTVGYGIGTAPKLNKWLSLNADVTANQVSYGNFTEAVNLLNKVYVGLDVQTFKKLSFTFGITLNGYLTDTTYDGYANIFTDYNPNIMYDKTYGNNMNLKMWLGARIGIRFL